MNAAYLLNTAWMRRCSREKTAFERSTCDVARTQTSVLKRIISGNRESLYGRRYRFERIDSPIEFQRRVPITDYTDYVTYVDQISKGETSILTVEPVRLLEPTSGTTNAEKLIPYTDGLKREFQAGVDVWIADLFRQRAAVRNGRAFWSISPATSTQRFSSGGIPIGFADDTEYLGTAERWLAKYLTVVPSSLSKTRDIEQSRYTVLLHLILAGDLTLVSIWSPTYLTTLIQCLESHSDRIIEDLQQLMSVRLSLRSLTGFPHSFSRLLQRQRIRNVLSILQRDNPLFDNVRLLWPRLALISCWTDAGSAPYISQLRSIFRGVEIQPKGLLATEGFVSIPLVGRPGAALAIRSHFFEFINHQESRDRDESGTQTLLAHELERGCQYRVVLTTSGGLYRYQLHDLVEVVGFERQCPLLRFAGKSNLVSDLVGEKLSEPQVREVLSEAFSVHRLEPRFMLLTPFDDPQPRYRLYLQATSLDRSTVSALRNCIQSGLERNPHYRLAIELKQLGPLEICVLNQADESASRLFQDVCLRRGQKLGDIKCNVLDRGDEWANTFDPIVLFRCP